MPFRRKNRVDSAKKKKQRKGIVITLPNVLDLIRMVLIASITFILISILGMCFVDKQSDSMVIYTIVVGYNIVLSIIAFVAYKKLSKKLNEYN